MTLEEAIDRRVKEIQQIKLMKLLHKQKIGQEVDRRGVVLAKWLVDTVAPSFPLSEEAIHWELGQEPREAYMLDTFHMHVKLLFDQGTIRTREPFLVTYNDKVEKPADGVWWSVGIIPTRNIIIGEDIVPDNLVTNDLLDAIVYVERGIKL